MLTEKLLIVAISWPKFFIGFAVNNFYALEWTIDPLKNEQVNIVRYKEVSAYLSLKKIYFVASAVKICQHKGQVCLA